MIPLCNTMEKTSMQQPLQSLLDAKTFRVPERAFHIDARDKDIFQNTHNGNFLMHTDTLCKLHRLILLQGTLLFLCSTDMCNAIR